MASDGMPAQHRGGPWWVVGTEALEVRTGERQRAGVLGKLEPHQRLLQVHPCFAAFATPQLDVGQRHQIMAQRMRPPGRTVQVDGAAHAGERSVQLRPGQVVHGHGLDDARLQGAVALLIPGHQRRAVRLPRARWIAGVEEGGAPFTLVGKTLWLRATDAAVALFEDYRHVATHPRAKRPGQRVSVREHLPPEAQAFFGRDRAWCAAQAEGIGPSCQALVGQLLADRVLERLRAAQAVLALLKPYGQARLEAACARALAHGSPHYRTVKTILATGADHRVDASTATPISYGRTRFTRPATELFADLIPTTPQQDLLH